MTISKNSSFQPVGPLLTNRQALLQSRIDQNRLSRKPQSWWTPFWRGLVADSSSKHRRAMGPAIWIYLYLLTYANRKTGIVRRTQESMHHDTGYSIRAIQSHLQRLKRHGYIRTEHSGRYLTIYITKWKGFQINGGNSKMNFPKSVTSAS